MFAAGTERERSVCQCDTGLTIVVGHAFPVVEVLVFLAICREATKDFVNFCRGLCGEHAFEDDDDDAWRGAPNPTRAKGRLDDFRSCRGLKRHAPIKVEVLEKIKGLCDGGELFLDVLGCDEPHVVRGAVRTDDGGGPPGVWRAPGMFGGLVGEKVTE